MIAIFRPSTRRTSLALATALLGLAAASGGATPSSAQQAPPAKSTPAKAPAKAQKSAALDQPADGAPQAIVALVNDEPITGFEIDQRARLTALSENIGDCVKGRFQNAIKQESTSTQVKAILEKTIKENQGKTREQILAVFEQRKTQFAIGLQKQAADSCRAGSIAGVRKKAQDELIDERLKLQEAKKLGIEVNETDVTAILKSIADNNKMTEKQFSEHLKGMGADVATMRARFRASVAWRDVVRRRFAAQVSVAQRDIDKFVATASSATDADTVELQIQKITLPLSSKIDQGELARRYADADGMRRKFDGCKTMANLAQAIAGAKFEGLQYVRPSTISEPTRSLLLSAREGEMPPPTTSVGGVEIYAVCAKRPIPVDAKQREQAQAELTSKEYDALATRHLRDLRQDAHIEYR